MNEKDNLLKEIEKEIEKCRECKKEKTGLAVAGEGNPFARLMFIGEAPGREEAKTGRPFIGRSGQLLTKLLAGVGIERKDVFITSPVKYYPGKRAPNKKEIAHGKKHLIKQIEVIQPQIIVLLGNTAIKALLDGKYKVTRMHGRIVKQKYHYFITFHPAAALRFPQKIKKIMEEDLKRLKDFSPKPVFP